MYNECNFLTSRNQITLDGWTFSENQIIFFFFFYIIYITVFFS